MKVQIKKINDNAIIPKYQTKGAAGFDFHSVEDVLIGRNWTVLVDTGLSFQLPEGYELQIRPRSGLALDKHLTVLNSPGTVDSDYRGEIGVILHNTGNKAIQIEKGDRIAQGVIKKVEQFKLEEVDELEKTERGDGGFGSTGKG